MTSDPLESAAHINLETVRRNGAAVQTPVWQTAENGRLYVWTQAASGKVKRIRNHPQVRVAPCDMRGTLRGDWRPAIASVTTDGAALAAQEERMRAKYGWQFRLFDWMYRLRRTENAVIEIALDGA